MSETSTTVTASGVPDAATGAFAGTSVGAPVRVTPGMTLTLPDLSDLGSVPDDALLHLQASLSESSRRVGAAAARVAGEIARRSDRQYGHAGLAQRNGERSADKLIQRVAGISATDARALVRVGEALDGAAAPWLAPVTRAVEAGTLSVGAADAIRSGLGAPSDTVAADDLHDAATELVAALAGTPTLDPTAPPDEPRLDPVVAPAAPEVAAREARAMRDAIDEDGIGEREEALRQKRSLRLIPQIDGTTRITGVLDPESAAIITAAVEAVTAPRRGGPRFVGADRELAATELVNDLRTVEQIAVDALVDMVRFASTNDRGVIFRTSKPIVRVHVGAEDLARGAGKAWFEGQNTSVSVDTAARLACTDGYLPIRFDSQGQVLDLGREQRLFTPRQREALAARDGGCMIPGCICPAAFAEAHHVNPSALGGKTDVRDGILLCRFHHMNVHARRMRIERRGAE
jgi:hypothetical protein